MDDSQKKNVGVGHEGLRHSLKALQDEIQVLSTDYEQQLAQTKLELEAQLEKQQVAERAFSRVNFEFHTLASEHQSNIKQLQFLQDQNKNLERNLSAESTRVNVERTRFERQLTELSELAMSLEGELAKERRDAKVLKTQMTEMIQTVRSRETKFRAFANAAQKENKELKASMVYRLQEADARVAELEKQRAQALESASQIAVQGAKASEEVSYLSQELEKARGTGELLQQEADALYKIKTTQSEDLTRMQHLVEQLTIEKRKIETAWQEQSQANEARFNQARSEAQAMAAEWRERFEQSERQAAVFKAEVNALFDDNSSLRTKLDQADAQIGRQSDDLNAFSSREAEAAREITNLIQTSREQGQSLRQREDEISRLNSVLSERDRRLDLRAQKEAFLGESLLELQDQVRELRGRSAEQVERIHLLEPQAAQVSPLQTQVRQLHDQIAQLEARNKEGAERLVAADQRTEDLKAINVKSQKRIDVLNAEMDLTGLNVRDLEDQVARLKAQIQDGVERLAAADQRTEDLKAINVKSQKHIDVLNAEMDLTGLNVRDLEDQIARLKAQIQDGVERLVAADQRAEYLKTINAKDQKHIVELNETLDSLRDHVKNIEIESSQRHHDLEMLLKIIEAKDHQLTEGQTRAETFESQLQQANTDLESTHQAVLHMRIENQTLRQVVESLRNQNDAISRSSDERERLVNQREAQLRNYSQALIEEKEHLKSQLDVIAGEIRSMRSLNPLHEYLELTEREVSRLEVQLAKTPTISPDRGRLEKSFADLVDQRDFLRAAAKRSNQEIERHLRNVSSFTRAPALAVTPPLPPKSRSNGENQSA